MTVLGNVYMTTETTAGAGGDDVFVAIGLPEAMAMAFAGARKLERLPPDQISPKSVKDLGAAMLACPLMGTQGDAIMIIAALEEAGYSGTLTVISPRLPNADMVERELRSAASRLRVNLITL